MHVGHQQIVRGVVQQALDTGRASAVITFHPHPLSVVAPDRVPKQILTLAQKEELLREMGVDALLVVPFYHEFSRWTAGYRVLVGDASAHVQRLVSRDLDRATASPRGLKAAE